MFELFKVGVPAFRGLCMCTEAMFEIPRSCFCLNKKGLGFRNLESQAKNIFSQRNESCIRKPKI